MNKPDTANPVRVLSDVLEHISRHDKPLGFLFGSGTSCAVTATDDNGSSGPLIPGIDALTDSCREEVRSKKGDDFRKAWDAIEVECREADEDVNIENILSRVQMKKEAVGSDDTLLGLYKDDLEEFDSFIRRVIADRVQPSEESIPEILPHDQFAKWLVRIEREQPVEIFTTNYDLLFERALEDARVPVFDGFIGARNPFFSPESLTRERYAPGPGWTRLWKIHGSVNWRVRKSEGVDDQRVIRGEAMESGEMIFPSFHKYRKSRKQPYTALLDRLGKFMDRDDVLLVCIGYGFADQHINEVLFDTLQTRSRAHLVALQYENIQEYEELRNWANRLSNVMAIGPEGGILEGEEVEWEVSDATVMGVEAVGSAIEDRSGAEEDPECEHCQYVAIGDFNILSEVLAATSPHRSGEVK